MLVYQFRHFPNRAFAPGFIRPDFVGIRWVIPPSNRLVCPLDRSAYYIWPSIGLSTQTKTNTTALPISASTISAVPHLSRLISGLEFPITASVSLHKPAIRQRSKHQFKKRVNPVVDGSSTGTPAFVEGHLRDWRSFSWTVVCPIGRIAQW